ncbi:pectate lyase family protein [Aridibaculum aurantiacum]|uniref:pectate lyase family protein n=1 Tax=Aridibaculum aurantiacum TaxID=2810307 RepID=UPI001A956402|nr:polysaccharide lyase [Aridibaculum aurantiacum]
MKRLQVFLAAAAALAMVNTANGQYPTIPKALEDSADAEMKRFEKLSDEAWAKALPIVEAEAKKGKPFIPWAAKPEDLPQAKIPAFPGAEGGGAFTPGGRGGKVYVVTNLNDSGEGSFRWACEQGGARTIVFNVAGIIQLKSPVIIRAPYITIAGQSAPGDGVCIAGESVWINTHDVVIRYMRFRRGATDVTRRDDALGGNPVGNIMIDHVSASWGLDENMSMYRHVYDRGGKNEKLPTVNVTIQNSIFSECLDTYNHSFGSTIGGLNSTFMRNLWANNISRNPSIGMYGDFGFVNNVVFNWWNRSADGGDHRSYFNFINNYYKPGPMTPLDKPIAHRILKPESGRDKANAQAFGKAYVSGNIVEGFDKVTQDNWAGGIQVGNNEDAGVHTAAIRVNEPMPMAKVTILPAKQAYDHVLENVGANLPKRDAVDARIIKTVKTGEIYYKEDAVTGIGKEFIKRRLPEDSYKKGIITHPSQVGGYPEYKGTPYKDSDKDGMPDSYEKKMGLNPNNAADASKVGNTDGYTNLEIYLNSLVPPVNLNKSVATK